MRQHIQTLGLRARQRDIPAEISPGHYLHRKQRLTGDDDIPVSRK